MGKWGLLIGTGREIIEKEREEGKITTKLHEKVVRSHTIHLPPNAHETNKWLK